MKWRTAQPNTDYAIWFDRLEQERTHTQFLYLSQTDIKCVYAQYICVSENAVGNICFFFFFALVCLCNYTDSVVAAIFVSFTMSVQYVEKQSRERDSSSLYQRNRCVWEFLFSMQYKHIETVLFASLFLDFFYCWRDQLLLNCQNCSFVMSTNEGCVPNTIFHFFFSLENEFWRFFLCNKFKVFTFLALGKWMI